MALNPTQAGSAFGSALGSVVSPGSKVFGASPLGTILGAVSSPITAALNYQYGRKAAQEAYDRQIDFWKMQNEYNLPVNARKRLEDAGFNPMAAVQGISQSQAAGGLSSVSLNPAASPTLFQNPVESLKVLAEIDHYRKHSSLLVRQAASQFLDNIVKRANLPAAAKKALWYANHQEEVEEAGLRQTETQADRNSAAARLDEARADTEDATRDLQVNKLEGEIDVNQARITLMNSQEELNKVEKELTNARIAFTKAQTSTERERAKNLAADTAFKWVENNRESIQYSIDLAYAWDERYQKMMKDYYDVSIGKAKAGYAPQVEYWNTVRSKGLATLSAWESALKSMEADLAACQLADTQTFGFIRSFLGIVSQAKSAFSVGSGGSSDAGMPDPPDIFTSNSTM